MGAVGVMVSLKVPDSVSRRVSTGCSWSPTISLSVTAVPWGIPVRDPEMVAFWAERLHDERTANRTSGYIRFMDWGVFLFFDIDFSEGVL